MQFVCVESLVTAIVDMYPAVFRRKNRRELFLLAVALFSFFVGLIMLMEVGVTLWDHTHTQTCEPYTHRCMHTGKALMERVVHTHTCTRIELLLGWGFAPAGFDALFC